MREIQGTQPDDVACIRWDLRFVQNYPEQRGV